jgi:hypothetical protein
VHVQGGACTINSINGNLLIRDQVFSKLKTIVRKYNKMCDFGLKVAVELLHAYIRFYLLDHS